MQVLGPLQVLPGSLCRYYSLFTLAMLVMFESTVVTQRLRNLKELRSLQNPKQPIMVYRQGKWEKLPGDALLPGDVISIGRPAGGEPAAAIKLHESDPAQGTQRVLNIPTCSDAKILVAVAAFAVCKERLAILELLVFRSVSMHVVDYSVRPTCLSNSFKRYEITCLIYQAPMLVRWRN